jgi:glycosyltransferase involved in cell wall biosynthesis
VRILHVVGNLNRAGAETWLMQVFRRVDRRRVRFDFLVHADREYAYSADARALGAGILACPWPAPPTRYASRFRQLLESHGPYDIVHCHLNHVGAWLLWQAHLCKVPRRILHTHTGRASTDLPIPLRLLERAGRRLRGVVTDRVAPSALAASAAFGPGWAGLPNTRLLQYGIDLSSFERPVDPAAMRRQLNLSPRAFVIGHVGRFVHAKNHELILRIMAAAVRQAADVRLLLVGDGPRRLEMVRMAHALGLERHVIFAGVRPDVPDLMRGCMDAFVLPSRYEGLGLVAIEAQASGLPCVLSDRLPEDATVSPDLVRRLPLAAAPAAWASALLDSRREGAREDRQQRGREAVGRSVFTIERSVTSLMELYERAARGAGV